MKFNLRKAFKGKNAARKRRNTGKKVYRAANTAGKALYLAEKVAKMVNAEKKRWTPGAWLNQPLAQCNVNAVGYFTQDTTPIIGQGITAETRNGASIKLCSLYSKIQLIQESGLNVPMNVKYILFQVLGAPQTASTFISNIFNVNTMVSGGAMIDYNSSFDPDFYGTYKILYKKNFRVPASNYSGQTLFKDYEIKIKFNRGKGHHIRYNDDGTVLANGQLIEVMLCDSGNLGATGTTLNGAVPVKVVNSGVYLNKYTTYYFYDN